MKKITVLLLLFSVLKINAQKITNIVLVGPNGVTDDLQKAESFIVVKQFDDHFERLDYKKAGPLIKSRSYKDADLKILEGHYFEYRPNGAILYSGMYKDNKKDDYWRTYDDTAKVISSVKYANDIAVDTVDLKKKDSSQEYGDEREAEFPGGVNAWIKYMIKSLEKNEAASKSAKGGKVVLDFIVGANGIVKDVHLIKSVEFVLDEDAVDIIKKSPKWNAAWQNGHAVNAYRRQPISYTLTE
jgi:protein TonB